MAEKKAVVRGSRAGGSYVVKTKIDPAAVEAVCGRDVAGGLVRAGAKARDRAAANIRSNGRVNTGMMVQNIRVGPVEGSVRRQLMVEVTALMPYAMFQESGTKAHGPVRAKKLRFRPKGSTAYVFARWVRGVKPAHFMLRSAQAITPGDFA